MSLPSMDLEEYVAPAQVPCLSIIYYKHFRKTFTLSRIDYYDFLFFFWSMTYLVTCYKTIETIAAETLMGCLKRKK